ncbi:hypothetical protein ACNKHV_00050 [Shigella flexneri]
MGRILDWYKAIQIRKSSHRQKIQAWFLFLKSTVRESHGYETVVMGAASVTSAKFWNWQVATVLPSLLHCLKSCLNRRGIST